MANREDGPLLLVTCEHGGNRIPADLAPFFRHMRRRLTSHRGYDPGALVMARALTHALKAPLVASTTSRLVIDLNRSLDNAGVWSEVTRSLPPETRERIVRRLYVPYRRKAEAVVAAAREVRRPLVHFSSHSFTPVLGGKRRRADVGLLYDPSRPGEAKLCAAIKAALHAQAPWLHVRRNYPYAGKSDGLVTWLRSRYAPREYVGVEVELNQAIVGREPREWRWLRETLVTAIMQSVGDPRTAFSR
jgi:predicted N-formylglutamate amidohydrolase